MTRDTIFSKPIKEPKDFAFDAAVAHVFDDMISRSVPLYEEVQNITASLIALCAQTQTSVYDLGCSTGTTLLKASRLIQVMDVRLIGVDSSQAMLAQCGDKLDKEHPSRQIELVCGDVLNFVPTNASVVILNYTLMFLPREARPMVLNRIFANLKPKGLLVLTEKVRHEAALVQETLVNHHHEFKRRHGYSELEISQKREALENVLVPLTLAENVDMLAQAGFSSIEICLKWYNFALLTAVKN